MLSWGDWAFAIGMCAWTVIVNSIGERSGRADVYKEMLNREREISDRLLKGLGKK